MGHPFRTAISGLALCLLLTACGSSAASAPGGASSTATPPSSLGPSLAPSTGPLASPTTPPPPSASLDVVGTGGLSGHLTLAGSQGMLLRCAEPSFDGLRIEAFVPTSILGVNLHLVLSKAAGSGAATVSVSVATATAPPQVRSFSGTGVPTFDPDHGATIDSTLTEQSSGADPGSLGGLTSIKGTVDCGNQTAGSSTLAISGSGIDGLDGPLGPTSVACLSPGPGMSVIGMAAQPGKPAFRVVIGILAAQLTVAIQAGDASAPVVYTAPIASSITGTAASVDADVTTTATSGQARSASGKVHLAGDVSCGNAGG